MSGLFRWSFRAQGRDEAAERMQTMYGRQRLGGLVSDYRERVVGDTFFSIVDLRIDGDFQVETEPRTVVLGTSARGFGWEIGRDSGDLSSAPVVFQPGRPATTRGAGRAQLTSLSFDSDSLADLAAAVYGEPTLLRFDGQQAVSVAAGRNWNSTVAFVRDSGVLDNDLTRAAAYRLLAATSLGTFQLAGDRGARATTAEARLQAYRRAAQFIEDHLSLPITTADIAAAAGLGEAALEGVFRAYAPAGLTPREQLQRARLAAAHHDLLVGDPTLGETVQAIAARWGFIHLGRFAALHRLTYGEDPKHVLDR